MRTATATPPPFPFPGRIGCTFCATIASTLSWPRTGTAASKAPIRIAKMFIRFIARFFTAPSVFAMLLHQSAKQYSRTHDEFASTCRRVLRKAERDIVHRSFHNQRMSTLTKPALQASHSDVVGRYAQMRDTTRVHERALFLVPRIPSELELQARWFAGDFGREFVSTNGDQIDIVQFGVWNREAGPDFRECAIRINGGEPIHGCIEIDLLDRSWESHGHATNPAFEATALHVFVERSDRTFFTRTLSNRNVPQVRIDPTAFPRDRYRARLQRKQIAVHTSHTAFAAAIAARKR